MAIKYAIDKYKKNGGNWDFVNRENIFDDTPTPYHLTFPENKSPYPEEWMIKVQRQNDPDNCNSSGVTYTEIPTGQSCFCTCENISYFYFVRLYQFPKTFGEGVSGKTYEILTGYTQGCGTLSATTDSALFEDRRINIGHNEQTDEYTFSATVVADTSTGVNTGAARIYFKSYYDEGSYDDCSIQIDFEQSDDAVTCDKLIKKGSGDYVMYYNEITPCPGPATAVCTVAYDNVSVRPLIGYWYTLDGRQLSVPLVYSYVASDNLGWSLSGTSCDVNRTDGINWGKNMSTADTRDITITYVPYVQGGCYIPISSLDDSYIVSGTPCYSLAETAHFMQAPYPGCGCYQLKSNVTTSHSCDFKSSYYYGVYTTIDVVNKIEWKDCWTVDHIDISGDTIESGGTDVRWISIYGVIETPPSQQYAPNYMGELEYYIPDYKNYGDNDWVAEVTIHWKGKGDNVGNTCTTYVTITKVTSPSCAPSVCDCEAYTSRVDKSVTLDSAYGSTGKVEVHTSSYYPCGDEITEIESIGSIADWYSIAHLVGSTEVRFTADSENNSCETRSATLAMRLTTSNPDYPTCDFNITVKQLGKCTTGSCSGLYWVTGYSACYISSKETSGQTNYIGDVLVIKLCGDCASACQSNVSVRTSDLPNWIDVTDNGDGTFILKPNLNAGTQTDLIGTVKFDVAGSYCQDLDFTVKYDYTCNCNFAWYFDVTTVGYSQYFPSTGGTLQVGKIEEYEDYMAKHPCLDIVVTSTSQWDGSTGIVETISVSQSGVISVTCRANTGALLPFKIDLNMYTTDGVTTTYCGDSYHKAINCQIAAGS